jgi:hypothetical protein
MSWACLYFIIMFANIGIALFFQNNYLSIFSWMLAGLMLPFAIKNLALHIKEMQVKNYAIAAHRKK